MKKVKTTINIDEELWRKFSVLVIKEKGTRKKNEIIEQFIRDYVNEKTQKTPIRKAIILAAGMASRLRPLTKDIPQCLLKINSKTILEHQLQNLRECGIQKISMVIGHMANKIKNYSKEIPWDINLIHNKNYSSTSNLFSLWLAKDNLGSGFITLNSNLVFDIKILKRLLKSEADICIVVDKKSCREDEVKVKVSNGRIVKIDRRIALDEAYGEFFGMVKFSKAGVEKLIDTLNKMPIDVRKKTNLAYGIQSLINSDYKVEKVETQGLFWSDIDFIEDLREVQTHFLAK